MTTIYQQHIYGGNILTNNDGGNICGHAQAEGGRGVGNDNAHSAAVGGNSGGGGGFFLDGKGGQCADLPANNFLNGLLGSFDSRYRAGGFGGGGGPCNGGGGGGGYDGGDCNIGGTDHDCHGGSSFGGEAAPNSNANDGYVSICRVCMPS